MTLAELHTECLQSLSVISEIVLQDATIKCYDVEVEDTTEGSCRAVYIYLSQPKNCIRTIDRQININDGSIWIAILDVDKTGTPVGLELING